MECPYIVIGIDELDKYGTEINFANNYIKFGEDILEEGLKEKEDEQEDSTAPNKVCTSMTNKQVENKEEKEEEDIGSEVNVLTTNFKSNKMRSVVSQTMYTDERKEGKKRRRRNRKKRSVTPIQVDTNIGPEEKEEEEENLNVSTAPKVLCTNMTQKEVEILDEEETVGEVVIDKEKQRGKRRKSNYLIV
ncbi:histone-lysine N-methyltransferase, H3 lysine-79 specific-like [Diabrotica virgifera virgifera]|uniref:Uncharacterized protein n=1 Tax=Diabrotica virgifera virgifera TaxID=50390 RepID=A0ABM5JSM2_DIAVI|nr:histone-lysine N-methyltransferase, H3 lysine-79 specific-like [Diabrotica virgifera virgifera]